MTILRPAPPAGSTMADEPQNGIHVVDRRWWARGEPAAGEADAPFEKPSYVQELEARVAAKDEELRATIARYREASAEFDQARARLRRDVAKEVERGARAVLADLLDVVDNLDRAIESGRTASPGSALVQGVELVRAQFLAKLEGHGVRPLEAAGHGRPIVIGPSFEHFSEVVAGLAAAAGVLVLPSGRDVTDALAAALLELLGDPARRAEMGTRALEYAQSRRGVARRYARRALATLTAAQ